MDLPKSILCYVIVATLVTDSLQVLGRSPFGPPYPITGSWFKDRFSRVEWNATLNDFSKIGGDTVLQRAPPIIIGTMNELKANPEFKWCGVECFDGAVEELTSLGLKVAMFAKYSYEEDYSHWIIQCPMFEKKIVSSRIYHRLVLPLNSRADEPCNYNGTDVMILLTSFAGVDPHELLLESARDHNMSVYFGLPQEPIGYPDGHLENATQAYGYFFSRVLTDYIFRFSETKRHLNDKNLIDVLKGFAYSEDVLLGNISDIAMKHSNRMQMLGEKIHSSEKQFVLSTFFQTNRFKQNASVRDITSSFETLAKTEAADIFIVKDGRGSGNSGLFWETQQNTKIAAVDNGLYRILKYQHPSMSVNATFGDVFSASSIEVFSALAASKDKLSRSSNISVSLWLNIEAYEYLHDDPCLPIDTSGSGLGQMLNRITKPKVDNVLTHLSAFGEKVTAFAWDPCFTCKTKNISKSLSNQVEGDMNRPIIASCSFHSVTNRSVVVIGYNLLSQFVYFKVNWPNYKGERTTSNLGGYYFEVDWGVEHNRVPSLMYIQLYDPDNVQDLADNGYVIVTPVGGYHACAFEYDFSNADKQEIPKEKKKYYYYEDQPRRRVFGQNRPRIDDNKNAIIPNPEQNRT